MTKNELAIWRAAVACAVQGASHAAAAGLVKPYDVADFVVAEMGRQGLIVKRLPAEWREVARQADGMKLCE